MKVSLARSYKEYFKANIQHMMFGEGQLGMLRIQEITLLPSSDAPEVSLKGENDE